MVEQRGQKEAGTLIGYRLKKAFLVLKNEIETIPDVQTWAAKTGMSRSWLLQNVKKYYGESPSTLLRNARYRLIISIIEEDPEVTGYGVARMAGLKDEKALYKFLSRNYVSSLTDLRCKILKNRLQSENEEKGQMQMGYSLNKREIE